MVDRAIFYFKNTHVDSQIENYRRGLKGADILYLRRFRAFLIKVADKIRAGIVDKDTEQVEPDDIYEGIRAVNDEIIERLRQ
jgi:hypothetical protein